MSEIIKVTDERAFQGCDFVVKLEENRRNTEIRMLQLTDMQIIDRTQERGNPGENPPDTFEGKVGNHIRSVVAQTQPDLIFLTGDIVYGMFDDSGRVLEYMCDLMDSFEIPWAPVFGNHDNECWRGVAWQCERLAASKYSLFKRGTVTGSGNYTVGVAIGEDLVRVLHMTCSNGGGNERDPEVVGQPGIYPDQADRIRESARKIEMAQNKQVPAFMAFHIPVIEFIEAEEAKGYRTADRKEYVIGVDVPALDNDFGVRKDESFNALRTEYDFMELLHSCNIDGVFVGHCHEINTCISYQGVRWVYGLKTGTHDSHPVHTGGTLVTQYGESFHVRHIPSLV